MPSRSLHWTDPSASQALEAPAGETLRIGFRVSNDMPKPVGFRAVPEGLPQDWLPEPETTFVGPYDSGEAAFNVRTPQDAAEGEYEVFVRLFEGSAERWGEPRMVRITLTAPLPEAARPAPVVEARPAPAPPPAKKSAPKPPKPTPAPVEPVVVEPTAVEPTPVAPEPTTAPEPVVAPKIEPVAPKPEVPDPVAPTVEPIAAAPSMPVVEPTPAPSPTPIVVPAVEVPKATPAPKPKADPPKPPAPKPVEAETVAPAPTYEPKIIDLEPERPREPVTPPKPAADRTVVDPKDGQILPIRPGETVLLKIPFENKTGMRGVTRTYVIQENRALPRDWIEIERDQVSVTSGGSGGNGFVSARLKPPLGAEPTQYPFLIETGPLGEPLEPRSLVLDVQPIPAVALECEKPSAAVWFRRDAEFELAVSVAGNSDTAYRVVPLADPDAPATAQGTVRAIAPVAAPWRRLVERELGNLASPVTGRRPAPEKHKVRLRREGVWWFGWQEKHAATIEAVPVTDESNGAKGGNRVALTATRRRLLPVPWFVAAPLGVLAFLFLSGGPTDFRVTNAVAQANGVSYILAKEYAAPGTPQSVPVALAWKDAVLGGRASRSDVGNRTPITGKIDRVSLAAEYQKPLVYSVGNLAGGPSLNAVVVGQRTNGAILITRNGAPIALTPSKETLANGGKAAEATIVVPRGGQTVSLIFKNTTSLALGNRVFFFQTQAPSAFVTGGLLQSNGTSDSMSAQDTRPVQLRYRGQGPEQETWELVTTDAKMPVLRIHLKVAP